MRKLSQHEIDVINQEAALEIINEACSRCHFKEYSPRRFAMQDAQEVRDQLERKSNGSEDSNGR